jgi:hypothetical protein
MDVVYNIGILDFSRFLAPTLNVGAPWTWVRSLIGLQFGLGLTIKTTISLVLFLIENMYIL